MDKSPVALIVIDMQEGFDQEAHWGGNRNNKSLEENITRILAHWRDQHRPVFHVQHASTEENSPLRPGSPGYALKPYATPKDGEAHITKNVNSAFIGNIC